MISCLVSPSQQLLLEEPWEHLGASSAPGAAAAPRPPEDGNATRTGPGAPAPALGASSEQEQLPTGKQRLFSNKHDKN